MCRVEEYVGRPSASLAPAEAISFNVNNTMVIPLERTRGKTEKQDNFAVKLFTWDRKG